MMTQYASQLKRTRTDKTIVEAVPTQILLPNIRAHASDYAMLNLFEKELDVLLNTGSNSRLALIRDDQESVVVDADLSALGPNLTILGGMEARETRLAHMLPYVSLVDDQTVRTRVNELFQCIRLDGVNSYTTDDAYLDKVTSLFARIIAQLGPEFSYYIHKISKAIAPELEPVRTGSFAGDVDRQ